jgi:molybdenum cofactor cytidylyltransferase
LATEGGGQKAENALEALVLAAGAGSRFGGGKLTAAWRGGVLLDGALAAAFAAPARRVSLVWGADAGVADAARTFAMRVGAQDRLRLVHAPRYAEGLAESLKAGVASLPRDCTGAFVFLGDMPRVPHGVLAPLAEALAAGAPAAAPTFAGQRGHPVLFGRAMFGALLALTGDRGAGALLSGVGATLTLVEAPDDGVLFDVDRPSDLA